MPHKEYVELYIKAYYLPESNLETWMIDHNASFQKFTYLKIQI